MKKAELERGIKYYTLLGFFLVVLILWLNELCDLPHHLLKAPVTPINWQESIIESIIIILLSALILRYHRRLIMRIKYLEGFLPVCTLCKKIHVNDEWIPLDEYIRKYSELKLSYGACPACMKEIDDDQYSIHRT